MRTEVLAVFRKFRIFLGKRLTYQGPYLANNNVLDDGAELLQTREVVQ